MAFTTVGCLSAIVAFPTQSWQAGVKTIGPLLLPDKFRGGMLLVDLTQVTDLLAALTVNIELSMDGTLNWTAVGGWGLDLPVSGYQLTLGVLADAQGDPVRISGKPIRFPQPGNLLRQVRGTITLSAPMVVGMTLVIW